MLKEFMKVISLTYQQLLLNGLADLVEEGEGGLMLAHHHQVHGPVPCHMLLIAPYNFTMCGEILLM
jgi:hypothetical protein